jgi:PAS domain-containing protein
MEHGRASLVYLDRDFNLLRMNAAGVAMICGLDGKILRHNVASTRMLGYQPADRELSIDERRARLGGDMVGNPSAGPEQMPAARALRGETVRSQLMRLNPASAPDGPPTYVMVGGAPIRDQDGRLLGAVTSFSDVTELRRARDDLEFRVRTHGRAGRSQQRATVPGNAAGQR